MFGLQSNLRAFGEYALVDHETRADPSGSAKWSDNVLLFLFVDTDSRLRVAPAGIPSLKGSMKAAF